ncbi:DUF1742-domain-containing protein [Suillus paluster]|uniref:DUF1742-domain-containing protein n=1 Tax=Suillus paluster TaxID=48578 RepID=UPI001B86C734|nr:DUF1742-domain-containing protein [Suillus paluster]KAG1753738.1 DUF1742-domain-containing protein [Suillus paluster]
MSFPNLYYKRATATAKACYICYKPTTVVLATIDTSDFLYTCTIHLADHGFATRVLEPESENKIGVSLEEIAKVREEWEKKQKQKKEKEKEKEKEKADKDKTADEDEKKDDGKSDKSPKVPGSLPTSGSSTPKPTHEKYVLHRDIFALRVSEHRRRRQTSQAKDLAPRLPGAPSSSLS